MRMACTLHNQKDAQVLSAFLTNKGIENEVEVVKETDWGMHTYGDVVCRIWIINEDDAVTAAEWVDEFKKDPNNPIFQPVSKLFNAEPSVNKGPSLKLSKSRAPLTPVEPLGKVTLYVIVLCFILFLMTEITAPAMTFYPETLPATPLFSAPLKKKLLYDYPYAYEIVDKLVSLYGVERLQDVQDLPPEGQLLITKFQNTPYWQGYYDIVLNRLQGNSSEKDLSAPMFEKLHEGEFWRLISPCFLHSDILHILFNMIWVFVLGKQMEKRLGSWRYIFFIILTGVFSNTAQYLMGGPNFIGFSGVICGMLAFIWVRQNISAWEGYQLERATMLFMVFFILSMFSLQLISFYLEANNQAPISPGIANTAHLSGAALGYVLGRLPFFRWKI